MADAIFDDVTMDVKMNTQKISKDKTFLFLNIILFPNIGRRKLVAWCLSLRQFMHPFGLI